MLFLSKCIVFFFTPVVYTFIEYFYSVIKNDNKYTEDELHDAIYNGLGLVVTETVSVLLFIFLTTKLYKVFWGDIPSTTLFQVAGTVIVIDFLYYFYHRVHHGNLKLYTIHRIHHLGTKYNLSLALMLPWVGQASIYLMLVPLVFFHIPPYTIISAYFFLLAYQLFSHISYFQVPKWCDLLFVTPRSHRIHHYRDKVSQRHNFGAVFSIWDRVFGTYSNEEKADTAFFGVSGYVRESVFSMQKETVVQFFKKW